jgi:hypothetical protein
VHNIHGRSPTYLQASDRDISFMRDLKTFVTDVARKPPMIMPYVGAAHLLWLVWTIVQCARLPFGIEWMQLLWMAGYAVSWIAACDLKKWGALVYMGLTITNAVIFLAVKNVYLRDVYMSSIFLIDGIFSFYLLFFFKRFSN